MKRDSKHDGILPASIRLGRVVGIPVGLHYSWFLIAALITFSLAANFRGTHPQWTTWLVWTVSGGTAVLFFVTLLAHELMHAVVARQHGLPVRSITLFALGGVAQIGKDATSARTEFLVAIVGPIASFAIGLACVAAAWPLGWRPEDASTGVIGAVLGWLGSINILLALFNLIPAYPLDGGRVLGAALWAIFKDPNRATRAAARVGQGLAVVLIALGLLQFFAGAGAGGLWLAFIGWFLLLAAQASYQRAAMTQLLRGVRVADVMAGDCATVDARTSVKALVDDLLARTGRACVMVKSDGRVLGLVTPHDVSTVQRNRWPELTARDVMRPIDRLEAVAPDTPAIEAFTAMTREDVHQLPVVFDGRLEGIVSRGQILQLLQSRAVLKA